MNRVPWQIVVPALLLESGWMALLLLSPLRNSVWSAIALLIVSSAVYLIMGWRILKHPQSGVAVWIVAAGLIFRLTAFGGAPDFSDDVYRYRWEAKLQAAGGNPYVVHPNDSAWAGLRDATFDRIPGRDFRAVYGPLTELVYRGVIRLGDGLWWIKAPAAVADLGVLAGLWMLLPAVGLGRERILLYAWCPLPVFEFWANGHNDALMLCPLVLAFWAWIRGRRVAAFAFLAIAACAKVWPLALVPLFGITPAILVMLPVAAAFAWPFGFAMFSNGPFLSGFLGGWRNNDSLFGLLLWITGDPYAAKYAAFVLVAAAVLWAWRRRMGPVDGGLVVVAVMLLVSANCHPWYLTWMLPMLVVRPIAGLLLWVALCPLFYAVLPRWFEVGEWNGSAPARWVVYVPVFAVLVVTWARSRSRESQSAKL